METDKLQNIWKNLDSEIKMKSIDELNKSLTVKIRQTINKFLIILVIDIAVCAGMVVFLIITALNRSGDTIYLVNNSVLCSIIFISMIVSLVSLIRLNSNKLNLTLKNWVQGQISLLSKWLLGKHKWLYIIYIPVLLLMIILSIHIYYENKPFIEVVKNTESITGLIVGFLAGMSVSFYVLKKVRIYHIRNLRYLKELYEQLCNESV